VCVSPPSLAESGPVDYRVVLNWGVPVNPDLYLMNCRASFGSIYFLSKYLCRFLITSDYMNALITKRHHTKPTMPHPHAPALTP
jgi:hypothetical protein